MKKQILRFTLYAITVYLTGLTPNPAVAASQVSEENETHLCGVIDGQLDKQHSDQFLNRHYAQTFAANLNVGEPGIVRLIYFRPRDREPQPDIDIQMDRVIKEVQQFYADQMESHGFGRKTFRIETDGTGKAIVHHVTGKFNDEHYPDFPTGEVSKEISEQFDTSKDIFLVAVDTSRTQWCGVAPGRLALLRAPSACVRFWVAAHELGHTFGLDHDYRNIRHIMHLHQAGVPLDQIVLSKCSAEWLDVHPFFNTGGTPVNQNTTAEMLPPSLVSPPNVIRLRFEVTDPDGLHQAQLFGSHRSGEFEDISLLDCKRLNGKPSSSLEFVTTGLTPKDKRVILGVIDVHGNFTWRSFPIDITPLLPHPEVVSIPDAKLAAIVRETLGLSLGVAPTSHTMLELRRLNARNSQITDLIGLEHAHNLRSLLLGGQWISQEGVVNSNAVSDFSPLLGLTQLTRLELDNSAISDVSPLAGLTQLTRLELYNNSISDVSPLSGLTKLEWLFLHYNAISDLSALSGLTQLNVLNLHNNSISDVSPLAGLTKLGWLSLWGNSLSDVSALAGLTQLKELNLSNTSILDVSPLAGLTKLRTLNLSFNSLSDLSVLSGLTQLKELDLSNTSISDVSVLSGLTQLERLFLQHNSISAVSALAGLTNLRVLHLAVNSIVDVSALSGLTQLERLFLHYNAISDLSALSGLTQLEWLGLEDNAISDVSALAGLTQLEWLILSFNSISDVSALARLTNLQYLVLNSNAISDVSPLLGLNRRRTWRHNAGLYLEANPLSYASINTHIPALQSRGIEVRFDAQAHPALLKISGDNQKGTVSAPLSQPFVVEAQDENGSSLQGISITFAVTVGSGTLSTTTTRTDQNGRAQSTLTLGPNSGRNTVQVSASGIEVPATFHAVAETESPPISADVNGDGSVNILDLVSVASQFGNAGTNLAADVSRDGVVNILDLVLVAGTFGDTTAAPSAQVQVPETLTTTEVQGWLTDAVSLEVKNVITKKGIVVLEQLLAALTPTETELLTNYPNPFNPETWIPYRLAEDAFVTLTIYDLSGQPVRRLEVGHRIAAVYERRSKAIYWDGRNGLGEQVASGVYFYTLTAGDYSATRKMVILK